MIATQVNVPDWLLPGLILIVIGGVLTLIVRAAFKSFREWIRDWFNDILAEIKPNGGNTNKLGDLVVQLNNSVTEHGGALQRVEDGVAGIYPRMEIIEREQHRVREQLLKDEA